MGALPWQVTNPGGSDGQALIERLFASPSPTCTFPLGWHSAHRDVAGQRQEQLRYQGQSQAQL